MLPARAVVVSASEWSGCNELEVVSKCLCANRAWELRG